MSKLFLNFTKTLSLVVFGIILLSYSLPTFAREPDPPPPARPPDWLVLQKNGQTQTTIPIAWKAVSEADYYIISYKTTAEKDYTSVKRVDNITTINIEGLTPATSYNVAIQACNRGGCSGYRIIASDPITTKPGPPAPPAVPVPVAPAPAAPAAPATQTISGLKDIFNCNPVNPTTNCTSPIQRVTGAISFKTLGDFVSGLLNIAFFVAIFLAFYWLVWGAFQYIMAQGKKEELAKARARITWAIIGLIIILLSYSIAKFASEILTPGKGGLPF